MYPYTILTVFFLNCIADSMAGGQAKKGNGKWKKGRCQSNGLHTHTHKHFSTEIEGENTFKGLL